MLAEAINKIADLACQANTVSIVKCAELPREILLRKGTDVERIAVPPPDRKPQLSGLSDLLRALEDSTIAPAPEVYVSSSQVVALLDRQSRIAFATLPMPYSKKVAALIGLLDSPVFKVKDAIKFLRLELSGAHCEKLLPSLRKVDFARKSTGQQTTQHGRESLGRTVEAMVQGVEDIPEEFRVRFQAYNVDGLRSITVDVGVRIHIDVAAEAIELHPERDELETALLMARQDAANAISSALNNKIPVFVGTP